MHSLPIGGGTTSAVRELLVSTQHAAGHVGYRPVFGRSNRYILSIGDRFSVDYTHASTEK